MAKQSPVKNYNTRFRVSHSDYETINGRKELVSKSWPDVPAILDEIRKEPVRTGKRKGTRHGR